MEVKETVALFCLGMLVIGLPIALEAGAWAGYQDKGQEYKLLSPATLKRGTKMNWVGCVLTWIALGIVSPAMFIFKCIYNLFHI